MCSKMNIHCSFQTVKQWLCNLVKTLLRRFRWGFLVVGFIALAMAGLSWTLETSANYWFWHRYCTILLVSLLSLCFYVLSGLMFCSFKMVTAFGILQYIHPLSSSFAQKQTLSMMLKIRYLQLETMHWLVRIHLQEVIRRTYIGLVGTKRK